MLERKITRALKDWKDRDEMNCLVVNGARQVGKTWIIDKFCRENYEHYTYINFIETPKAIEIFEGDLDVENLIKQISIRIPGSDLVPNHSVIFLDEIQACPKARTALKFFALDRRFSVITSGSLLGINYQDVPSFPVGYVERIEMHSLDFEEFLWANGISEQSIADLRHYYEQRETVPTAIHNKMMELFKEYIIVGGMPRVVWDFVNHHNFASVLRLQRNILSDYEDDIAKYAEGTEKAKARSCFLSIPKQLSKDYKKFQYSVVEKRSSASKFAGSLMWLYDAGIINFCYNLTQPELPLEGNAKNECFKVYMRDTGLLMAMLEDGSQEDIIDGNLGIYKGAIYENIIADIFGKLGKKLYYYERDSKLEVDFVIRYQKQAVVVEVKSAENTKSKSMDSLLTSGVINKGIKLSSKNIGMKPNVDYLPLYMAMFL